MTTKIEFSYKKAGVDMSLEQQSVRNIINEIMICDKLRKGLPGEKITEIGLHAGVIKLWDNKALGICMDGVGSKSIIVELLNKYDTIGIDCVASNVNDLICVGAEPIAMVDYLAMGQMNANVAKEIARGLADGAKQANISIPGGEIATMKDTLRGMGSTKGFELVGTTVGVVDLDKMIDPSKIRPNDKVISLESSGIHCNGMTLAREVLLRNYDLNSFHEMLGKTIGEELLTPTKIYVKPVLEMIKNTEVNGLSHITSWGITNLQRVGRKIGLGFKINNLPEPHAIFKLIQEFGNISIEEMYKTFNMGIGFCIICPQTEVDTVIDIADKHSIKATVIGEVIKDIKSRVFLEKYNMILSGEKGEENGLRR